MYSLAKEKNTRCLKSRNLSSLCNVPLVIWSSYRSFGGSVNPTRQQNVLR